MTVELLLPDYLRLKVLAFIKHQQRKNEMLGNINFALMGWRRAQVKKIFSFIIYNFIINPNLKYFREKNNFFIKMLDLQKWMIRQKKRIYKISGRKIYDKTLHKYYRQKKSHFWIIWQIFPIFFQENTFFYRNVTFFKTMSIE